MVMCTANGLNNIRATGKRGITDPRTLRGDRGIVTRGTPTPRQPFNDPSEGKDADAAETENRS